MLSTATCAGTRTAITRKALAADLGQTFGEEIAFDLTKIGANTEPLIDVTGDSYRKITREAAGKDPDPKITDRGLRKALIALDDATRKGEIARRDDGSAILGPGGRPVELKLSPAAEPVGRRLAEVSRKGIAFSKVEQEAARRIVHWPRENAQAARRWNRGGKKS